MEKFWIWKNEISSWDQDFFNLVIEKTNLDGEIREKKEKEQKNEYNNLLK